MVKTAKKKYGGTTAVYAKNIVSIISGIYLKDL